MALRRFTYHNATGGYLEEQAADDELSLGKVTAIGVDGVAFDASGQQVRNGLLVDGFTASGSISAGAGLRISGANQVSAVDASQSFSRCPVVAVAVATAADGAQVLAARSGLLQGVLSGANPGDAYFLGTGSGQPVLEGAVPSGAMLVLLGFAANATDLMVVIRDYGTKA